MICVISVLYIEAKYYKINRICFLEYAMLYNIIQNNFVIIANIVFLIIFVLSNSMLDKYITQKFKIAILLLIMLTVTETIEQLMAGLAYPTMLRVVMSAIGYASRPLILYFLLLIAGHRQHRVLLAIPAVINILVVSLSLWTKLVFWYDEANVFVRGVLGFSPHICSLVYFAAMFYISAHYFRERYYSEAITIFAIFAICSTATVLESIYNFVNLLRGCMALSVTFYYLYLYTQFFKRDSLTGVLNRRCFYNDGHKYMDRLIALISIDLNDLKTINDEHGHAEGDKALVQTIDCIRKNLMRGCVLYRVGGDEFAILCQRGTVSDLQYMIEDIRQQMKHTRYSCAIGFAEYRGGTLDELCARADAAMYEDKAKAKNLNR